MPHPTPDRQSPSLTLAVLALGTTAYALLQSLVAPALPEIQHALGTSESSVSWVLTAYLLSASIATPLIGRLGDMYGKERLLMIILVILALGTLLAAIATSITVLILARVIQGAVGGIFPLAFGIIRDEFPREKVPTSIGLMSALMGIGAGLGIVLSGVIVDNLDYHWLFWIPLVVVVIAAVATHLFVPESPIKSPGRVNWLAALLLSVGLAAVLIPVSETSTWGWGSAKTLGGAAAGLIVLAGWVWVELRSRTPLIDMQMMRIRGVWTTNLAAFLVGVGMYSSFILIPQLVELPESTGFGFGASVTEAGVFMLPATAFMLVAGPASGRLEAVVGAKATLLIGIGFTTACYVMLTIAHSASIDIYLATALLGVGIGLAFASLANIIVENVRQDQTGAATGMNTVMRTIGGAVGAQVVATFLTSEVDAKGLPTEHGFQIGFLICTGALVVAILAGLLIPRRRRRPPVVAVAEHREPAGQAA